jgi:PRTRC genetic system protein E
MFTELHSLAQKSTLMIVVTAEGDQLRVNVTPANADRKEKPALRPLSLIGTVEELDRDFAQALVIWQAPKKQSLLEQAAAAGDDEEGDAGKAGPAKPASKQAVKAVDKKEKAPKTKAKAEAKSSAKTATAKAVIDPAAKWPFPNKAASETGGTADAQETPPPPKKSEQAASPDGAPISGDASARPDDAEPGTQADGQGLPPAADPPNSSTDDGQPAAAAQDAGQDDFTLNLF